MALTKVATALNARLNGRFNPNGRYIHASQGLGNNKRGYYEITPGNTKQGFQVITNISNANRKKVTFEVMLNNDTIFKLNGEEIHKYMRDYHDKKAVEGVFDITFGDSNFRTREGIRLGELVTLPTDRLLVYVDLTGANLPSDPSIEMREFVTQPQAQRYFIPRVFKSSHTINSTSENHMMPERTGLGRFITRMHLLSADVNRVDQYQGDQLINEIQRRDNDFDLGTAYPKAKRKQNNTFHYDRTLHGLALDGLIESLPNTKFKLGMDAANSFEFIVEMIEQVRDLPQVA